MMTKLLNRSVIPLSLCATSAAFGQAASQPAAPADTIPPVALETKPEPTLNRFNLGFQLGFNLKANFKHIGAFAPQTDPGPATGGANHTYDDGYNRVDITGNDHLDNPNTTWNWGYQSSGQVNENNTISMHSTSSPGANSSGREDDPQPGVQLTFSRELFRDKDDRWRAGFETAFGYTDLEIRDTRPLNATVNRLTDTYAIPQVDGSYFIPDAPYSGTFDGPGRIISDTPTRTFDTTTAPVSGSREFDADVFAFRLGPYFEIPLNKTFSVGLSGGVAMTYVYSTFSFNETVITASGPLNLRGHDNNGDVLFGGYLGGQVSAALNDQWSLFAGAQWMDVGSYTHRSRGSGQAAGLDLTDAVFFNAGLGYSF